MSGATEASSRYSWLGLTCLFAAGVLLLMYLSWSSPVEPNARGDDFASERKAPAGGEKPVAFDGKRAMEYLDAVCKIGPRMSGSEGMKKQQELIEKHFTDLGAKVTYQDFTAKQKSAPRKPVEMRNLIVSYHPDRARRVILCSHYDTRPIADQEENPRRWTEPFVSANDGGSGVALLMELGNHMKGLDTHVGVDFVFFDGEEYIYDRDGDEYFFGSKHFAKEASKARKKTTYVGAILLDMVAGKGAVFPVEQNSWMRASKLVKEVWSIARELKCDAFKDTQSRFPVEDDHIALNRAGIPAIDIIDFDYPHWHKLTDVPKSCGPESMEQVAKVCSVWIQRVK